MTRMLNTRTAGPTMAVLMIILLVVAAVMSNVFQRRPQVRNPDVVSTPTTRTSQPSDDLEGVMLPTD